MAGTPVCLETCLFAFPVTSSVVSRETLNLPMLALMIPILAASFFLNTEGRFGYSQLVVGSVGTLMDQICICFIFFLNRMIATRRGMKPSLESHTFSGLVRWLDLADETTASDIAIANGCGTQADDKARLSRRGTLLAHDPVDSASGVCPCPLASCAGNLPNFAFWIAMLRSFVMIPIQLYAYLATVLTPLVTFGGSFWRVWWMSICGSLSFASRSAYGTKLGIASFVYGQSRLLVSFLEAPLQSRCSFPAIVSGPGGLLASTSGPLAKRGGATLYASLGVITGVSKPDGSTRDIPESLLFNPYYCVHCSKKFTVSSPGHLHRNLSQRDSRSRLRAFMSRGGF